MTQGKVAETLGVSTQAVSRWEQGASRPSMENLLKLCQLFQVEMGVLIGGEAPLPEEPEPPAEPEPPTQEEPPPAKPTRRLPLRDILWPVCLLTACAIVCATILMMSARSWDGNGQNETEVVPITDLEQKQIEISPEDYIEFDP